MVVNNPDWTVRMLNSRNLSSVIRRPIPRRFNEWNHTQCSDWVRLALLYEKGGVWMDASIIVLAGVECWVDVRGEYDIQGFHFPNSTEVLENWAMAAAPRNPFVQHWMEEWETALTMGVDKYCEQNHDKIHPSLYDSLPYLAAFGAFCVARADRYPQVRLRLLPSVLDAGPWHIVENPMIYYVPDHLRCTANANGM